MSKLFIPLDAELVYEHAYALLEEHVYLKGEKRSNLLDSTKGFKQAIQLNPLLYTAYFNLGKAYQLDKSGDSTLFDDVVRNFKRAALIRGNRSSISVEVIKHLLSLWPFIELKDRKFCGQLIEKSIESISRKDFLLILDMWATFSKEVYVLERAIKKRPVYYWNVARKLEQLEIKMDVRQTFFSKYEVYFLDYFKNQFPIYWAKSMDRFKTLSAWKYRLNHMILGYFKLLKNHDFSTLLYNEFKYDLYKKIVDYFIDQKIPVDKQERQQRIGDSLMEFLVRCDSRKTIEKLFNDVKERGFFSKSDLKTKYIELFIYLKTGSLEQLNLKGEAVVQSMAFLRKEQKEDYIKILLLMIENYIFHGYLEKAENVLAEVEKIKAGMCEGIWYKRKIEYLKFHPEAFETRNQVYERDGAVSKTDRMIFRGIQFYDNNPGIADPGTENYIKNEPVCKSQIFHLKKLSLKKWVYFMEDPCIDIKLDDEFKQKSKKKHLLQIIVNNWICFEQYLSQIGDQLKVKIKGCEWKKVEVEVRVR